MMVVDQDPPQERPQQHSEPREIHSQELFQGQDRLVIVHEGEKYRLLITRNGKLLLQK